MTTAYVGAAVFDGSSLTGDGRLSVADGRVVESQANREIPLDGGYLLPGLLDLQVNGGGGQMVCGQITAADLQALCAVHAQLGATGILPTLITDTAKATAAVLAAGATAARNMVSGFLGLHLEGPHLDPRRKGAHDPSLIRPMTDEDLNRLCDGAKLLPSLMITLAPESATNAQISDLASAGIVVSLGHSDCGYASAMRSFQAGATCVTHLFNAMSQIGNREPGLAGAALTEPVFAGLIADGTHVAPATMRIAVAAKPAQIFLVSDCMSVAGTPATEFMLGGRRILRRDKRLTLEDGTLAGADLTLAQAIRTMVEGVGVAPETAFAMATSRPAAVLCRADIGNLRPGARADFVHLGSDFSLRGVWLAGQRVL
ncbi:MAG: N-acetylglucosamine-6-phosphate deacetylase [Paracoccaceae bacterium]